jgi:transposase-like protein
VKYKRQIVQESEAHSEDGGIGALLRREGLYFSQLSLWRKQYREGSLGGKRRGPSPSPSKELRRRNKQLERENACLRRQLDEARVIVGFQKKACEIMGISLHNPQNDESD